MHGVSIFSRIAGETEWQELTSVGKSPYIDRRPLKEAGKPEVREYKLRFYDGFNDVGQESDIASIVFGG